MSVINEDFILSLTYYSKVKDMTTCACEQKGRIRCCDARKQAIQ